MALMFRSQPLVCEDHGEHGGHNEIESGGIERDTSAENASNRGTSHPGELVEESHEEVEPASVDAFGNDSAVVDGESLITQGEDEIRFFHPHVLEPAKHGNAVEQMPCA